MASKRKSTIPCMIPKKLMSVQEGQGAKAKTLPVLAEDKGVISAVQETNERGRDLKEGSKISSPEGVKIQNEGDAYGCQPCHFKTRDLNIFLDHVYSCHPDFRAEPSFHCLDCGVATRKFEGLALHNARAHPSSAATTLQLRKRDWKLTVEQKLVNGGGSAESEISISKTPIMKTLRGKGEHKRIVVSHVTDEPSPAAGNEAEGKDPSVAPPSATTMNSNAAGRAALPSTVPIVNGSPALSVLKVPVAQVLQNCTFLQQSVPTEVPTLQSSSFTHSSSSTSDSKNLPKVMIPLSSIPTYAAAMDTSSFLKTSFSKFPYPTKAELCYLTVVTNYPEEQIKIWFTAQRLKQGISWSPEEIEESRRKMFNTIIQEPNSQPIATHQQLQPHHRPTHRSHRPAQVAVTIRPSAAGTTGTTHILKDNFGGKGGFIASQPMTSNGIQSKKSQEQLGALKQSFFRSQFPEQEEVERLTRITGLTVREVRKWFSDRRYHNRNLKGLRASGILGKGPALDFVDSPTSAESPKASQSSPSPPPALSPQNRLTSQQESDDCLIEPHEKDTLERKMEGGDFDKEVDVSNNGKDTSTKEEEGCEGQVPSPGTSWQQCFKEDCEEEEDPMSNLPDPKPKINPIKINLKRLKVTEACSKQGLEDSQQDMDSQSPKTSSLSVSTCTPTRGKKTPEQMHLLKQVFARTQWPSSEQYDQLVVLTGLPRPEVVRWFGDSRYVFKNGQLKWLESYQNTIEMEVEEEKLKMAKSEDARAQDQPLALPSRLEVRGLAGSQKEHILHGSSATPLLPNGDKETETQKDQAIATEGLPPPNDEAALETKGQSTLNKPREAPS
ncbi:zinc fingers and homeoboxes protein 3-like, partial [Scleropages formosus]